MKLGLFGGSFDPVHKGHLEIAERALQSLKLDKLIFVPTPQNPLKESAPQADNSDRTEMLKIATALNDKFLVSEAEVGADQQQVGPAYSIDTVIYYAGLHQVDKNALFFLIGADSVKSLHLWKDYEKLFAFCTFVVFGRNRQTAADLKALNPELDSQLLEELEKNFITFEFPCSSTEIRDAFAQGKQAEVADKLDPEVSKYIKDKLLYR